jgi:hypothetical protein
MTDIHCKSGIKINFFLINYDLFIFHGFVGGGGGDISGGAGAPAAPGGSICLSATRGAMPL